jgi:hypothetical protein
MNQYDCHHKTVDTLEKELLFTEVMSLRNKLAEAQEVLLTVSEIRDIPIGVKGKIKEILKI